MFGTRRQAEAVQAERTARALSGEALALRDPEMRAAVATAQALRPAVRQTREHHDAVKAAMLRRFDAHQAPTRADAGSQDGSGAGLHRHELDLPDGAGRLVLVDVEAITGERLTEVASRLGVLAHGTDAR